MHVPAKDEFAKHKRVIIVFMLLGVVVVFGIWMLQIQQYLTKRYAGGVQDDVASALADLQAGVDFAAEVEQYAPLPEDPSGGLAQSAVDMFYRELGQHNAINAIAQQMRVNIEHQEASAAEDLPPELTEAIKDSVESEIQ